MINKDDAEMGQVVFLRPQTKLAPRECHLRLAAEILDMAQWPIVYVKTETGKYLSVHRDNIGLHPPVVKKKQGDGQDTSAIKVKPAFPPHKPLSGGDFEEPMLF